MKFLEKIQIEYGYNSSETAVLEELDNVIDNIADEDVEKFCKTVVELLKIKRKGLIDNEDEL